MNRPLANTILKIALLFFTITTVASEQLRYNGIWNKGETDHKIWVNSDWESFKKKWDELGEQGYRPVDIENRITVPKVIREDNRYESD